MPFCILDEKPYDECFFEFISMDEHRYFKDLYTSVKTQICDLIDLTARIGTQSLYAGVRDGSPVTLSYLNEIIEILQTNNIIPPAFDDFVSFRYILPPENDWVVWGKKIETDQITAVLKNNIPGTKKAIWQYNGKQW